MQKVLSAKEMREVDRLTTEKFGIPSIILMENAAQAAARVITERLGGNVTGKSFLILCGTGNNGGDGAALARILGFQGALVEILVFGDLSKAKGDALTNLEICKKTERGSGIHRLNEIRTSAEWDEFLNGSSQAWDVVVDAIFGTGLKRPLDIWFGNVIRHINIINEVKAPDSRICFSIDMPTGLSADLNQPIVEAFRADLTVTFTAPKIANVFPPGVGFNGELIVAEIGSPEELVRNSPSRTFVSGKADAAAWVFDTRLKPDSYKKSRGTALLVAGSKHFSGAAVLAANACFAAGAGMVTIAVPEPIEGIISAKVLDEIITIGFEASKDGEFSHSTGKEILKISENSNVVGIGCGLSGSVESGFVREVVGNRKTPMVVDADGLNALAPFDLRGSDQLPLVLTPHIGEFKRLLGTENEIADKIESARAFAIKHNVILVLKGERSLIAAPDGRVVINPTGNPGISRAGAGDTLTGIITGFLAQTYGKEKPNIENTLETVIAALYIAGLAGDLAAEKFGQRLMLATDIRGCLVDAIEKLSNNV